MRSQEDYAMDAVRYTGTGIGMLGMAGITLLQALNNKSLVIVAEICMPFELGAAGIYGRLAVKSARAATHSPIPGWHETPLAADPLPDTKTLAAQIGLEG